MDTRGFEPRAFRMRGRCDTTTPYAKILPASLCQSQGKCSSQERGFPAPVPEVDFQHHAQKIQKRAKRQTGERERERKREREREINRERERERESQTETETATETERERERERESEREGERERERFVFV